MTTFAFASRRTYPPLCQRLEIPTPSTETACDTFYRIYDIDIRSSLVDRILGQLDFHPLSITLLATVVHQNKWDVDRLTKEWDIQRTSVLQTQHNKSLAAVIKVSLASPMFQDLGPDAQGLLEVVAFFPQGVDESDVDWLFPAIPDVTSIIDKFCILSLTHQSGRFITMFAPLRDYLSPKDPKSSSLPCAAKECYFTRMSANARLDGSNLGESRWITSEDANVVSSLCSPLLQRRISHKSKDSSLCAYLPSPASPPLPPPRSNSRTRTESHLNNQVRNHTFLTYFLLLETLLLLLSAPVLAVWVRTLSTAGYTPFDGDHNFLCVAPWLLVADWAWTCVMKQGSIKMFETEL